MGPHRPRNVLGLGCRLNPPHSPPQSFFVRGSGAFRYEESRSHRHVALNLASNVVLTPCNRFARIRRSIRTAMSRMGAKALWRPVLGLSVAFLLVFCSAATGACFARALCVPATWYAPLNRSIVVVGSYHCSDQPAGWCATTCSPAMKGDNCCDAGCNNAACDFDGGDCTYSGNPVQESI